MSFRLIRKRGEDGREEKRGEERREELFWHRHREEEEEQALDGWQVTELTGGDATCETFRELIHA